MSYFQFHEWHIFAVTILILAATVEREARILEHVLIGEFYDDAMLRCNWKFCIFNGLSLCDYFNILKIVAKAFFNAAHDLLKFVYREPERALRYLTVFQGAN